MDVFSNFAFIFTIIGFERGKLRSPKEGMIFYIFLDGVGIGKFDPESNPFTRFAKGFLGPLGGRSQAECDLPKLPTKLHYIPTDAHMGVPGLPQSATGQTALWTGIPGPKVLDRHVSGFPTITLRKIISKYSLIKILNDRGIKVTLSIVFLLCISIMWRRSQS